MNNKLLSENQSGFRKGDSCMSQLIAITHSIYTGILPLKQEVFFLIYLKHSIKYGTKIFYIS